MFIDTISLQNTFCEMVPETENGRETEREGETEREKEREWEREIEERERQKVMLARSGN